MIPYYRQTDIAYPVGEKTIDGNLIATARR
jgi:hypothetical protein